MMGLAGTGLNSCSVPLSRLNNLDISLPPLPLPAVVSEIQALLTRHGFEAGMAAAMLADRKVLTCLHMTAGIPGYVVLLWEVMLEYLQPINMQTAR